VSAGTVGDPLEGEVVVLAIPYDAIPDVLGAYGASKARSRSSV
jgi:predicted dinucleotide-binding enzyme